MASCPPCLPVFVGLNCLTQMICESTYNLQALVHTLVAEWPGDLQQSS